MGKCLRAAVALLLTAMLAACASPVGGPAGNAGLGQPRRVSQTEAFWNKRA